MWHRGYSSLPVGSACGRRFLEYLGIILEEHFEPLERHGGNVRTGRGRFDHMRWRTHGGGEDLSLEAVILVNGDDAADQVHPGLTDVVESPHEGADDVGPRFRGDQRLSGGEAEGHVDANAFLAQG